MTHETENEEKTDWLKMALCQLTVANLGFFAVMAMLAVYLNIHLKFSAAETGLAMAIYSVGLRFSRLAATLLFHNVSPRLALPLSSLTICIGYSGIWMFDSFTAISASLLVAGCGYGSNGVVTTSLASLWNERVKSRHNIFSVMTTLYSIAAAIAPLAASWLMENVNPSAPFMAASAVVLFSSLIALFMPHETPVLFSENGVVRTVKDLLLSKAYISTLMLVSAGWFVYTQKYSLLTLYTAAHLGSTSMIGTMLLLYALVVAAVSIPAGIMLKNFGISSRHSATIAFGIYTAAFLLCGAFPSADGIMFSIPLFGVAEAVMMPALNLAISDAAPKAEKLPAFSLAAIAIGFGEALGNYSGVSLFRYFEGQGMTESSFFTIGALSLVFAYTAFYPQRRAYAKT